MYDVFVRSLHLCLSLFVFATAVVACSSSDDSGDGGGATPSPSGPRDRTNVPRRPAASCPVVIDAPQIVSAQHVPETEQLTYNSNPPSSGPHYPVWPAFREYATPVPRGYTIHALEHGAVVLSYKCDPGPACTAIVDELRKAAAAVPDDPKCAGGAVRARIVITPDPLLDVPVAAAAWGWTYKAECVDQPTLTGFLKDNYGLGPEDTCADGRATF
jgi:hypothetical protein